MMRPLSVARSASRARGLRPVTNWIPSRSLGTAKPAAPSPAAKPSPASTATAPPTPTSAAPAPTAAVDPLSPLPERFRTAMRLLTHPVVVLTAHDGTAPRGMTMSSFATLSVAPPAPLVTFNIATPSHTLDAILGDPDGHFNIHVLSADGRGAGVASRFTRGNAPGLFDGVDYAPGVGEGWRAPVLLGDGVLHVLRCKLASRDAPSGGLVPVRDHVIVVAEVVDMVAGRGDGFGLAYADRRHRVTGEGIDV